MNDKAAVFVRRFRVGEHTVTSVNFASLHDMPVGAD